MKHQIRIHWEHGGTTVPFELRQGWNAAVSFGNVSGKISLRKQQRSWQIVFAVISGQFHGWLTLRFEEEKWSSENYILMPASVYGGNRVHIFTEKHLPLVPPGYMELNPPQMTGIVQHLDPRGGGEIEQMSGEYAFPGFGFFCRESGTSCWILTSQKNELGDYGYSVMESAGGKSLELRISSPCHRKLRQAGYRLVPAEDPIRIFSAGMEIRIDFAEIQQSCSSLKEFFRQAFSLRNFVVPAGSIPDLFPMSRAAELLRRRMETENWREDFGYYSTITLDYLKKNPSYKMHYSLAWLGGSMKSENLFWEGGETAGKHGRRELDRLFLKAQQKSGFFFTACCDDTFTAEWYPGDDEKRSSCMVRKNAEGFASLMRQIRQMKERNEEIPALWVDGMRKWADAFQRLWRKYKQFGYLLNPTTGEITVGGGAGGIAACTGLAMASEFFQEQEYLKTAEDAVLHYAQTDLAKGIVYGGVGDAFQATDSESAYMLLEALITVWEYSGNPLLLEEACFAADYLASWCVAYDYEFPESSTYGKMKMSTTGTVYANIQNRHSAPGFCSASGDALFKLYRATGKEEYLLLLQQIIRSLPQYVSRRDRPIHGLDDDRMNERINMADWEGKERIGELFNAACWPEVSLLLARIHIPGIYVRTDLRKAVCFDHIRAGWTGSTLLLHNTTAYDADATILRESRKDMALCLKTSAYSHFEKVPIPAGGKVSLEV